MQEFKEIEMSLLLAMADGRLLSPDTRPSTTGAINPSGAACWLRTLRSSVQGPLAALRSSTSATALHGACSQSHSLSRSASQASSSALQSPCASRPGSASQPAPSTCATHQQTQQQQHFPSEARAAPSFTRSASSASASGVPPRPRSGRPGSGSSQLDLMHGPGQGPGSFVRPSTASSSRPFSARPGTASGVPGSRIGTSASTGSGSGISGLYWAKNRISNPDGQASASGRESSSAAGGHRASGPGEGEGEDAIVGSQLTRGTRSGFGGSLAKDLRKWKQGGGAAVAGMSAAGTGDGGGPAGLGAVGSRPLRAFTLLASDAAADDSQHGSSHDSTHNTPEGKVKSSHSHSQSEAGKIGLQHLDYGALLEELRQWKVDTADRVLLEDPDTAVGGWGEGDDEELDVGPMAGGTQADILELDPTHSVDPLLHEHVNSAHSGSGSSEQSAASTSATTIAAASTSTASLTPAAARQPPMEHPAHAAVQGAVAAGLGGLAMPGAPRGGRKTMLSKVVRDVSSSFDQSMDTLSLSDPSANGRLGPSAPCQQGAAAGSNSLAVSAGRPPLAPGSQGLRQQPSFTDGMTRGSGRPITADSSVSTASSGGTGSEHCMLGSCAGRYAVTSVVGEVDVRSANPRPRARQAINDDDDE